MHASGYSKLAQKKQRPASYFYSISTILKSAFLNVMDCGQLPTELFLWSD